MPAALGSARPAYARLPHREFRLLPIRRLPVRPRQGRPYQTTMNGTFIVGKGDVRFGRVLLNRWRGLVEQRLHVARCGNCFVNDGIGVFDGAQPAGRVCHSFGTFLLPLRGHPGLLVFVIGVARGAARLLDLVVDHRDNRMIGDAALARTVVVQNVTEPKPALLH